MYNCEKHGEQKTEWCDKCETILCCDCEDRDSARFKDLIYDCADGERTVTINLEFCGTCGDVFSVDF